MKKKILGFGITILLFFTSILAPLTIVDISSGKIITKNKKVVEIKNNLNLSTFTGRNKIGLLTAELKMRKGGNNWNKNSMLTKVDSTIEYKIEIKPILDEEYENVVIVFMYDIYPNIAADPPENWEELSKFEYIEGSMSNTEHLEAHLPGFWILWIFPKIKSSTVITLKARAKDECTTKAAVLACPESINSIDDLAFDGDELTIIKKKSKSLSTDISIKGKLTTLLEKIRIIKSNSIFKNLFNLENIKSNSKHLSYIETNNNLDKNIVNLEENSESDIYYFISAKDSSDKLNNNHIDNIATIELDKGKNLSLSSIEIYLSNDMVNWIRADIVEEGMWYVGKDINIREKKSDDIYPGSYAIRLFNPSVSKYPLSECMLKTEKASENNYCDKRYTFNTEKLTGDNIKKSRAYCSYDAHNYNFPNMIYSADLSKLVWDSEYDYWEYYFNLDGYEQSLIGWTTYMRMYAEPSNNIINIYYPIAGSKGLDETNNKEMIEDLRDGIIIVTEAVIAHAYPWMTIPFTAIELVNLLRDSPNCDLEWQNTYQIDQQPDFHNCFAQMKFSINPEKDWKIKLNLETEFRMDLNDPARYNLFLDSKDGWPDWPLDMHPNGENKIKFNGESPASGEVDISIISKTLIFGYWTITVDELIVGTTAGHADHVIFNGDALIGSDVVQTVYDHTEDQFFKCYITDDLWLGSLSAVSEDSNGNFIDSDHTTGFILNLPVS